MAIIDAFSAEINGATQHCTENNGKTKCKVAFFSATAVSRMFFSLGYLMALLKDLGLFLSFGLSDC
jgi:hypothetical protein